MASRQRGAALLTVLLLVAVIALVASTQLDLIGLDLARARNNQSLVQARAHALGAEQLAVRQVGRLAQLPPAQLGQWHGRVQQLDLAEGQLQYRLRDASSCFNLNAVVIGAPGQWQRSETGVAQLLALLQALQLPPSQAQAFSDSLVDWIDHDSVASAAGAEDAYYRLQVPAYLSAAALLNDPSELLALAGVDAALYQRLRPWLCALPDNAPTPVNVNALSPRQAPLLVMLSQGAMSLPAAQQWLAQRPAGGWRQHSAFLAHPALQALAGDTGLASQIRLQPTLFELQVQVVLDGSQAELTSLLSTDTPDHARLLSRRWTLPDETDLSARFTPH